MTILIPHGFEPNYTLGFIKGLLENQVEFCVISSEVDHQRASALGVECVNLRGSLGAGRPFWTKIITLLRYYVHLIVFLFRRRKGIVHFTGIFRKEFILFEGITLSLCFKLFSSRYIYTAHNILPHGKDNSLFFRWIYRFIYSVPDSIIVHTQSGKKRLIQDFGVHEQKIIFISIGLNEEMPDTNLTVNEARKKLGFKNSDTLILFFGKIEPYKGLDLLIEAFSNFQLPSSKLIIAGWCPDQAYRKQITSSLSSVSRKDDIVFREEIIPNEEVEVYFKACDLIVMPYRNIYQSGIIFLSFRFGIPVLATDVGSLREYIEDDMGIITRTNDVNGLVEGLQKFFSNPQKYNRENIIAKAQKYKWGRLCKELGALYA